MTHHFPDGPVTTAAATATIIFILIATIFPPQPVTCLGVGSTIAISYSSSSTTNSPTVCSIRANQPIQSVQCYSRNNNRTISVLPNTAFESISGGQGFFCGLRSGGFSLLCWNTTDFRAKRIHFDPFNRLTSLTVGDTQVCAVQMNTSIALCWRFPPAPAGGRFRTVTSGGGFSCGVSNNSSRVKCWGGIGNENEGQFGKLRMQSLVTGVSHVCGVTRYGTLKCRGKNDSGQVDVPFHSSFEFFE